MPTPPFDIKGGATVLRPAHPAIHVFDPGPAPSLDVTLELLQLVLDLGRKHDVLGNPLQVNNLGQREYARLIATAGVRPIKFHGLRHTCATLLLERF